MDSFFYICGEVNACELIDFALHRYGDISYLMNMPFNDGLNVLAEGKKAESESRLWQQYVSIYPFMTDENFVSYADFKASTNRPTDPITNKSEIMLKVQSIINLTIER